LCSERAILNAELNRLRAASLSESQVVASENEFPFIDTLFFANVDESASGIDVAKKLYAMQKEERGVGIKERFEKKFAREATAKTLPNPADSRSDGSQTDEVLLPVAAVPAANKNSTFSNELVIKVGSTCAGYGKLRTHNPSDWDDAQKLLALSPDYYTAEAFEGAVDQDLRVFCLRNFRSRKSESSQNSCCSPSPGTTTSADEEEQKVFHMRAYTRQGGTSWKGNVGNVVYTEIELTPFLENVGKLVGEKLFAHLGGLDIFSVDLLRRSDGTYVILEVNDSATGLNERYQQEDMERIAKICVAKLRESKEKIKRLKIEVLNLAIGRGM